MLPVIVKVINSIFLAVASFYIIKNLLQKEQQVGKVHTILLLILLIFPSCFLFDMKYNMLVSLLTYIISIVVFSKIFNISIGHSILVCSCVNLLVGLVDGILSMIEVNFITYEQARGVWYISMINNVVISVGAYIISCFKWFQKIFENICKKVNERQYMMTIIFVIVVVVVMAGLYINIASIFKPNMYYTITSISIVLFFMLYCFYIGERNQYEKLNSEYNTVFDYVQNFENWIDDEQMYRHELKNSLSMLRGMVREKKAKKKIEDMLNVNIIVEDEYIEQLKNVPKGGLKGLLYYKIAIAGNKKVKMVAEVSEKVKKKIEQMDTKTLRQLCILLGIYIDNAIEAAEKTKKRLVTIEIYLKEGNLQFVISNSYKDEISLEKMSQKGYSTKGKNRGNGLYYAQKVISKSRNFEAEHLLLNHFYIQKLLVH